MLEQPPSDDAVRFPVVGAGLIEVSVHADAQCGNAVGVSVGVSWGKHGYVGGVMDRAVMRQLAEHLLELLEN